jgi:3-oxoacyl-[acyl-carrier protein] reductase
MQPRGTGVIVNMASICGIEGCAGFFHYSAAKAGVLGFTRAVAKEVIGYGIRVNALAPGFVETSMADGAGPLLNDANSRQVPQGRLGRPDEIAAAAGFLASDDARYFVGETLSPNGGYTTV